MLTLRCSFASQGLEDSGSWRALKKHVPHISSLSKINAWVIDAVGGLLRVVDTDSYELKLILRLVDAAGVVF